MDSDPAEHRHRDVVGPDAHAGQRGPARQSVPDKILHRLRSRAALPDGRDRRPAEGCRLGSGHHRRARRMARTRTMVTASWVLQRAHHGEQPYWAVVLLAAALGQIGLPGGGFGFGYGSGAGIADAPLAFMAPAMDAIKNPIDVSIPT